MTNASSATRAEQVRQRRSSKKRQPPKGKLFGGRRKESRLKSAVTPPVTVRSGKVGIPTRQGRKTRTSRRYDVALGMPGAEVRLPAFPMVRLGWRMVSGLLAGLLVLVVWAFWNLPGYQVHGVETEGLHRLSAADVDRLLNIQGVPVFELDPATLHNTLTEAFPEFADVDVKVSWPNRVIVRVEERQPVIAWQRSNGVFWVDAEGVAFPPRGDAAELPTIESDAILQPEIQKDDSLLRTDIYSQHLLSPEMVNSIIQLSTRAPEDARLVYDKTHGFGWTDPAGWEVYFGQDGKDIDMRLLVYEKLVKRLKKEKIQPALISLEYLHAPYYRLER